MAEINSTPVPARVKDETGNIYSKWTVLGYVGIDHYGQAMWFCRCECGTEKTVPGGNLRRKESRGCHRCAVKTHGMSSTPEYSVWRAMHNRCYRPETCNYARYGGRGITVCERWQSLDNFIEDMGARPSKSHSVDRIDNDGNYEPSNCRWATPKDQGRNKRNNRILTHNGKTMCLAAWAEELCIKQKTLARRLECGWSVERALATPVRAKARSGYHAQ